MANKEIGALTAATPLAGTETLHVVQGGNSSKATVQDIANLSGGMSIAAAITASQNVTNAMLAGSVWQPVDTDTAGAVVTLTVPDTLTGTQPFVIENTGATHNVVIAAGGATVINAKNGLTLEPGGVATLMPKGGNVYRFFGDTIA